MKEYLKDPEILKLIANPMAMEKAIKKKKRADKKQRRREKKAAEANMTVLEMFGEDESESSSSSLPELGFGNIFSEAYD